MTSLIKPQRIQEGDTVATVSLSWGGPGAFPWKYEYGVRQLESLLSVNVKPMRHVLREAEWLKENPKARADDLMEAFLDPGIKAIISTIGGDDSIRLMPYIDLDVIRENPKIFMGYSDTTVTHFACRKAGLSSFYGPSIMAGFAENGGVFPYTANAVRKLLCDPNPMGTWQPNESGWIAEQHPWADKELLDKPRILNSPTSPRYIQGENKVTGHLVGGCLEVLEFIKGTSYWPTLEEWNNAVLFIETSEEAPSPEFLIRVLRNYGAQGILQRVSGILFGRPGGLNSDQKFREYDEAIIQVITREYELNNLPIVTHLDFGHTDPMSVLAYGRMIEIDPVAKKICLIEGAVQ